MVRIIARRVPPYDNGSYLLVDDRNDALLIDPAMGERQIIDVVREQGLHLVEILNTHGHADHIHGNAAVKEATRARLAIHRLDEYRLGLGAPPSWPGGTLPRATADDRIEDGPLSYIADIKLVALHTPGHTEGSTSFHLPDQGVLFSGDLLFKGNVGRFDVRGSDPVAMQRSLERVAALAPETTVYPGHGEPTTIGAELPNLRMLRDAGVLPELRV
jgi:glyoxylase-like metal-dependent hydrolase (beta-lactamase superfamily II)